jgi:hypothetical protein
MAQPSGTPQVTGPQDACGYARAVGNRVTELIVQALERAPHAARTDPDSLADIVSGLLVDRVIDPDRSELADLVAPLWTAEHTRQVLGLSRATMLERRKSGSLLALKSTDDDFFYPVDQFEKHGEKVRVKPALRRFFMVLRDRDPWTIATLLHTPTPELDNLTPLEWVRAGNETATLVACAEALNAEFVR